MKSVTANIWLNGMILHRYLGCSPSTLGQPWGGVFFSHEIGEEEDWIFERDIQKEGTIVYMSNKNICSRTTKEIFDKYHTRKEDYGFNKTVVPVRLLKHGLEQLISRSQAKRLLTRFERFKVVILDFKGVDAIGQAFADEIFRVFSSVHPEVSIVSVNATSEVKKTIKRAKHAKAGFTPPLFGNDA